MLLTGIFGLRCLWPADEPRPTESKSTAYYMCTRMRIDGSNCVGLASSAIDDSDNKKQVLRSLEPAAPGACSKAIENVQRDRQRLNRHWEQRLERASYDVRSAPNASTRPSSLRIAW